MNDTATNKRLTPKVVIAIYHDKNRSNFYLERRDIETVGDKNLLMAPVPLSDDVMKDVARTYMKTRSASMGFNGIIASHLLYVLNKTGKTVVMWYRPAMKRNLNFSASLKIKGESSVQVPATLYVVINTKLYVFALMTDQRPDLKTKLYNAPYFNIYEDGNVCLGTAPVGRQKSKTFEQEAERFERGFYMAEQNGGQSKNNCKTPLTTLWARLIKSKAAFPSKQELLQHTKHKTVGDLISKLVGDNTDDYEED